MDLEQFKTNCQKLIEEAKKLEENLSQLSPAKQQEFQKIIRPVDDKYLPWGGLFPNPKERY